MGDHEIQFPIIAFLDGDLEIDDTLEEAVMLVADTFPEDDLRLFDRTGHPLEVEVVAARPPTNRLVDRFLAWCRESDFTIVPSQARENQREELERLLREWLISVCHDNERFSPHPERFYHMPLEEMLDFCRAHGFGKSC